MAMQCNTSVNQSLLAYTSGQVNHPKVSEAIFLPKHKNGCACFNYRQVVKIDTRSEWQPKLR